MDSVAAILDGMRTAVPQGRSSLGEPEVRELARLTRRLLDARPEAHAEYLRFQAIRERGIGLDRADAADWLAGRTVLVTGGTGCIGSLLMEQLAALGPARLVSVSRGLASPWRTPPDAEYVNADIRDRARVAGLFEEVRPQIVFHLAAQRNPSLAEVETHRTITTNVFGTRNVLDAAVGVGAEAVVCASTGKALRPYSPDVYASSKRAAEWLMARAAGRTGTRISAARFTHVVDNSIIADRLRSWCKSGVIRLHGTSVDFYAQSALESAQLLLASGLGGRRDVVRMHALRDLDWPVNLLDLALGAIIETRSDAPIYIAGYEDGYEQESFPGLYDPRTAGGISPLINAFEAASTAPGCCAELDAFDLAAPSADEEAVGALAVLEAACAADPHGESDREGGRGGEAGVRIRGAFEQLSQSVLDTSLRDVPTHALRRAIDLAVAYGSDARPLAHDKLLDALHRWADRDDG